MLNTKSPVWIRSFSRNYCNTSKQTTDMSHLLFLKKNLPGLYKVVLTMQTQDDVAVGYGDEEKIVLPLGWLVVIGG